MGTKNFTKAKTLTSDASSIVLSESILALNCLAGLQDGQQKDCVNYWLKGREQVQSEPGKKSCMSDTFTFRIHEVMVVIKNKLNL